MQRGYYPAKHEARCVDTGEVTLVATKKKEQHPRLRDAALLITYRELSRQKVTVSTSSIILKKSALASFR